MGRRSRRALLAAVASGALGGCSALDDEADSVTPYEASVPRTLDDQRVEQAVPEYGLSGPAPLGNRTVPPTAGAAPEFARERTYAGERRRDPVGVLKRTDGLSFLTRITEASSLVDPRLVRVDTAGAVVDRRTLSALPTPDVNLFARAGDRTVVGGRREDGPDWLYDTTAEAAFYETSAARFRDLTTVGADVVVGGVSQNRHGFLARVGLDGTVRWEQTFTGGRGFDILGAVGSSAVAYGTSSDTGWLVAVTPDGTERWRAAVPGGAQQFVVVDLAVGDTGVYALARGFGALDRRPNFALVAVGADGDIRWQRVLDDDASFGQTMFSGAVLDRDGPVVAGGPRLWRASFDPDGRPRWAEATTDESVQRSLSGGGVYGDTGLFYGTYADAATGENPDPWLAWL